MSAIFHHAMRYEWVERNPIKLVRQSAKRERTPDRVGQRLKRDDDCEQHPESTLEGHCYECGYREVVHGCIASNASNVLTLFKGIFETTLRRRFPLTLKDKLDAGFYRNQLVGMSAPG